MSEGVFVNANDIFKALIFLVDIILMSNPKKLMVRLFATVRVSKPYVLYPKTPRHSCHAGSFNRPAAKCHTPSPVSNVGKQVS